MKYVRLCKGVSDKGTLVSEDKIQDLVDNTHDWYASTFFYTEEHKKQFEASGSIRGIENVTTTKLYWDFDSKDPNEALQDAKELVSRLSEDVAEIYFSGNKGFHVLVHTDKEMTPEVVAFAAQKLGDGLKTLDLSVYNASRILRIPGTKHQKSGLYKFPLSEDQLFDESLENIKEASKDLNNANESFTWKIYRLADELVTLPIKPTKEKTPVPSTLDLSQKPAHWKPYKWALAQGHFESGERHQALMVIAATCRGLGYDKETTYYICKAALKKQAERTGTEDFPKEELWNNIIEQSIFSDNWEGGQFSPQNNVWLSKYCERMGISVDEKDEKNTTDIITAFDDFKHYALNIDDLTIKTGIPALDAKVRMTVGMSVGLVASPGVGKTSVAIQMLNNMSREGHQCIFFSYDMYGALVIQKLVQRHFGIQSDDIFKKFQEDPKFHGMVLEKLKEEYKNVDFCFRTGQTVSDINNTIKESEDKSGKKIKFMVMDYNELVITDKSDPTQSSAFVAQKMRELATVNQMAVLSLFQPSKMSGLPSDEIKSYHAAKGSSAIAQSVSVMLGMSRPGFDARRPEDDIFANLACLKNRMGQMFSLDFHWDGLKGMVRGLSQEENIRLQKVRERKKLEQGGGDGWE